MTSSTFYGATYLLTVHPTPERAAELAALYAARDLPEVDAYDYRLSQTVPDNMPVLEASTLLSKQAELPGSVFLVVYPADTTGKQTPAHGTIPR